MWNKTEQQKVLLFEFYICGYAYTFVLLPYYRIQNTFYSYNINGSRCIRILRSFIEPNRHLRKTMMDLDCSCTFWWTTLIAMLFVYSQSIYGELMMIVDINDKNFIGYKWRFVKNWKRKTGLPGIATRMDGKVTVFFLHFTKKI